MYRSLYTLDQWRYLLSDVIDQICLGHTKITVWVKKLKFSLCLAGDTDEIGV